MNLDTWTIDQILGLAPDHLQANAAETAAKPENWSSLGINNSYAWGSFSTNQSTPYHSIIALPHVGLSCDCPSRKLPCRHSISLLLLLAERPELFTPEADSNWMALINERAAQHTNLAAHSPVTAASAQAPASYKQRLARVKAGMRELELWLRDMIHQGTAALVDKPPLYWREMADRLIDEQAFETAKEVRYLSTLPNSRPDWPVEILRRAGRLYLLTQGFSRYDSLAAEAQADLRFAAGWFIDPGHEWSETHHDSWLIFGKRLEVSGGENLLHVWLWGNRLKRPAHLIRSLQRIDLDSRPFVSGSEFDGTLHFFPSAWPVRAELAGIHDATPSSTPVSGYRSLQKARHAYGRALSLNPWVQQYPLLLQAMKVQHDGQRWLIHDGEGYTVPLPEKTLIGWHLQRVTFSEEVAIFGEWDGRVFRPLTLRQDGRWLDLHTLRGVI